MDIAGWVELNVLNRAARYTVSGMSGNVNGAMVDDTVRITMDEIMRY